MDRNDFRRVTVVLSLMTVVVVTVAITNMTSSAQAWVWAEKSAETTLTKLALVLAEDGPLIQRATKIVEPTSRGGVQLASRSTSDKYQAQMRYTTAAEKTSNTTRSPYYCVDRDTEVKVLALLAQMENDKCYEGLLAAASVVMNRCESPNFPDTIMEVIFQPGQFSPVGSGKLQNALESGRQPSADAVRAAEEAIAGKSNISTRCYSRRNDGSIGLVIGSEVYRYTWDGAD